MIYLFTVIITLVLAYLLTWLMIKIAHRFNLYDIPSERKVHYENVPILGGVGIIIAFFIGEGLAFKVFGVNTNFLLLIFLSYLPIMVISIYDDLKETSVYLRLLIQIISVTIIVVAGPKIEYLPLPVGKLSLRFFSYPITIFWYLLLINGFNFIDGLDGLAAGIACIGSIVIFITKSVVGDQYSALFCLGLLGSSLGFLRFNFFPAKIFMGDTGANFLGFTFAAISLLSQGRAVVLTSLLIPITALSLPIVDVLHHIVYRAGDRKGLFVSDKDHIHHRFLQMGFHHKWVVIEFYLLTALLGGVGLFLLTKSRLYIYTFTILFLIFSVIWFKQKR